MERHRRTGVVPFGMAADHRKRGSEGWGYFPTLDAEFRTQRNLDQLPTRVVRADQSEELPVEPTLLGRIRFGFRTLRDALKESPRPIQEQRDKVAYSCPCGLKVGVPSTYVGWFRCLLPFTRQAQCRWVIRGRK